MFYKKFYEKKSIKYSIFFSGVLLPEFDTKSVIQNLYNMLKLNKETIRKILTSKNPIIISCSTEEELIYLIKLLQSCGLVVFSKEKEVYGNYFDEAINDDKELLDIIRKYRDSKQVDQNIPKGSFDVSILESSNVNSSRYSINNALSLIRYIFLNLKKLYIRFLEKISLV